MRGNLKFFAIALLFCALTSCSMETDVTPESVDTTPKTSYTILYYSCSSGLDNAISPFFDEVTKLDIPNYINVVGQVKWNNGVVERFVYDHEVDEAERTTFADRDYRVDNPENLAAFISWARETAPADKYVMVFCGHGNAYQPAFDDVETRGILRDDNFPSTPYLGIGDIREAFDMAGVKDNKFALTMMICCLMNTLEYSTEFVPYTDYYLASGHVTVATSLELCNLISGFIEHGQDVKEGDVDAIVNSVKHAVEADYDSIAHENIQDTTLTKCVRIKKLNESIKSFANALANLYCEQVVLGVEAMQEKYGFTTADIDKALAESYYYLQPYLDAGGDTSKWYQCSYSYDIIDVVNRVAEATNLEHLLCYAADIEELAEESILYQYKYNLDEQSIFHAVTLVNKEEWAELRFEDANYSELAFDKATGWSEILKVNNAKFSHEIK